MRRWLPAAKLGLACRSSCIRQSSTVASPNLYLCFNEVSDYGKKAAYVVRRIELNDDGVTEEMTVEASTSYKHVASPYWYNVLFSTSVGSKILFPLYTEKGCRDFLWTDTTKRPLEIQISSGGIDGVSSLAEPLRSMIFGVVNGNLHWLDLVSRKLFRLDENIRHEVYDPIFKEFSNVPCISYPHWHVPDNFENSPRWNNALFFAKSKKIVAISDKGIYRFDVGNLEVGWSRVNDHNGFLFKHLRWIHNPFVVSNTHPDIGDFNLVFTLDHGKKCIRVFFMPNECDYAQAVDHCVELPIYCSDYLKGDGGEEETEIRGMERFFDFQFVRFGAQKFGLVLHKYEEGRILLLSFEYDVLASPICDSDRSKPDVDIKSRLVGMRVIHYKPDMEMPRPDRLSSVDLIGAFLLPENSIAKEDSSAQEQYMKAY